METKTKQDLVHARIRLEERFGLSLSWEELESYLEATKTSRKVIRRKDGKEIREVWFKGKKTYPIVDRNNRIWTVLSSNML